MLQLAFAPLLNSSLKFTQALDGACCPENKYARTFGAETPTKSPALACGMVLFVLSGAQIPVTPSEEVWGKQRPWRGHGKGFSNQRNSASMAERQDGRVGGTEWMKDLEP